MNDDGINIHATGKADHFVVINVAKVVWWRALYYRLRHGRNWRILYDSMRQKDWRYL